MKVYGIYKGQEYEGGSVMPGLYKSYGKAKKIAKDEIRLTEKDGWGLSIFKKKDGKDVWSNGIDVIAIKTFILNED